MKIYLSKPGVVCCAGLGAEKLWKAVSQGDNSFIKKVKTKTGDEFFAARIDDEALSDSGSRFEQKISKIESAALEQIASVVESAKQKYGKERIAVLAGGCDNGSELSFLAHKRYFECGSFTDGYSLEMQGSSYTASLISEKFSLSGITLSFSTACSSSASAIVKAAELIEAGLCDAAIAGGVDIASDTALLGFSALGAISSEKTNPMSENRSGITLGDAAAFFVLSKDDLDNTGVYLKGTGESADAYHMTSPDPSGAGAVLAMRKAMKSAGVDASCIDYVNLHGTGTRLNDAMEAKALCEVLGKDIPCSSTKSITGHTLGAAGALEGAVCFCALSDKSGVLPLQVWDGEKGAEIELERIIDKRESFGNNAIHCCMSNSFAFGGANVSLVFGKD